MKYSLLMMGLVSSGILQGMEPETPKSPESARYTLESPKHRIKQKARELIINYIDTLEQKYKKAEKAAESLMSHKHDDDPEQVHYPAGSIHTDHASLHQLFLSRELIEHEVNPAPLWISPDDKRALLYAHGKMYTINFRYNEYPTSFVLSHPHHVKAVALLKVCQKEPEKIVFGDDSGQIFLNDNPSSIAYEVGKVDGEVISITVAENAPLFGVRYLKKLSNYPELFLFAAIAICIPKEKDERKELAFIPINDETSVEDLSFLGNVIITHHSSDKLRRWKVDNGAIVPIDSTTK